MTIRIVGWNIPQKKMRPIAYEIDIYASDKVSEFHIVDSVVPGMELPGILIINAGRVLVFSMITGQLIRIIVDPTQVADPNFADLVFSHICPYPLGLAFAANNRELIQLEMADDNPETERYKYKKEF
jgi:hypothetical protein